MAVPLDGQYALHCWLNDDVADNTPAQIEYGNQIEPLQRRAEILIEGRRFKYITLSRYNDDWITIREFEA